MFLVKKNTWYKCQRGVKTIEKRSKHGVNWNDKVVAKKARMIFRDSWMKNDYVEEKNWHGWEDYEFEWKIEI
jgi:hypothetical protein